MTSNIVYDVARREGRDVAARVGVSPKQADPRALVLEHYAQRRAAVRDQFGEYGDDPSYADYSTWLAARYAAMREVADEECAALQNLKESTQPAANPQPVEDPRERLLELAAEARAVGDHKAETAALVEVLKADRREVRGEKAEAVLVVLLRTYIDAAVLAEQPPAWVEIDAALVALLPASTKAERRELVAQAGYGIARNWTNGSAGQLHLVELPAQDGEGRQLVKSASHTQKRTST